MPSSSQTGHGSYVCFTMSSTLEPRERAPGKNRTGKPGSDTELDKNAKTGRERFLDACACRALDYPPIWLMRQAGRALPEYRALKQKYKFLELVQTPDLAVEVTLQPIRRFHFDAAILFCDILAIAEGLGQRYEFREPGGIVMDFTLQNAEDIERLEVDAVTERLQYVAKALTSIKTELAGRTALIGFAGSPWTLANFMIEGGGVKDYTRARDLFYSNRPLFNILMEKLTVAITSFLKLQIDAGADALQIFDSLGGLLCGADFIPASGQWIKQIVNNLKGEVPLIVFSKGSHSNWEDLGGMGASVLGIDWNVDIAQISRFVPKTLAVQGNLDPFLLTTSPEIVAAEAETILRKMAGRPGHIFNLGHGVPPNAKLENIQQLVETVRNPAHGVRGAE
jgi:uroporphyrinogen decarboxylase